MITVDTKAQGNSGCNVTLNVLCDGEWDKVRLWLIVGGTPALAFEHHDFTERYPTLPEYADEKLNPWLSIHARNANGCQYLDGNRYQSQQPGYILGTEILPEGDETLYKWLRHARPLRDLRHSRSFQFGEGLRSRRYHDTDNRVYMYCEWRNTGYYLSPVTAHSTVYSGRCEDEIAKYAGLEWVNLMNTVNPLFDAQKNWEDLSDKEFEAVKIAVLAIKN